MAIIEVKFHFNWDKFVPSPVDKYASKLGLPLFVFAIDCRYRRAKIRFGQLKEEDFARDFFRLDTLRTIGGMDEIVQIIEKELR